MSRRYYVIAGLSALGLLGYMGLSRGLPAASGPVPLAAIALPDLDEDGQPDRLWLGEAGPGLAELRLDSSKAKFTHAVMPLRVDGPVTFTGAGGRWTLVSRDGATVARVHVARAEPGLPADLVVIAHQGAKRYHWVDRGFLKLDAFTVIPGFSVGLLMIGDPVAALATIGSPPGADGDWTLPLDEPLSFRVALTPERRVETVRYASPRMRAMGGLRLGMPLGTLQASFPGQHEGDRYVSPRYGLIAELDRSRKASAYTIGRPWTKE